MAVADLLYFGALVSVLLLSSLVLLRQFFDGDLTERKRTSYRRRTYSHLVSSRRERTARTSSTQKVFATGSSYALQIGAIGSIQEPIRWEQDGRFR